MSAPRGRRYLWPLAVTVLGLAIVAGGVFWLSQSPLLAIENIVIEGNHIMSEEQVMEIIGPRLRGESLLKLSFDDAGRALMEQPFVEDVEISRDFPDTVHVAVREYRPVVCYAGEGSNNYFLSDDSRILAIVEQPDTALPVLRTAEPCDAGVGGYMECGDVRTGVDFLMSVPLNLNQEFVEVSVTGGVIDARTLSGISIHFGTMEDHAYKFEVLRQLIARSIAAGEEVVIDVSVPDRPVTRNANAPAPLPETAGEGTDGSEDASEAPVPDQGQVDEQQ